MAKKDEVVVETPATEVYDPWKDIRTIKLRRANKGEAKSVYVCVNGVAMQVPRGKTVPLPFPLWDRLMKMEEAEEALDDYRDEIPNEMK